VKPDESRQSLAALLADSSSTPTSTNDLANLFDGTFSYATWNTGSNIVVTIEFTNAWTVHTTYTGYAFYVNNAGILTSYNANTNPTEFTVELSEDGTNWVTFSTQVDPTYPGSDMGNGDYTNFTFDNQYICVSPDTRILMADYSWQPIQTLKRGDLIVTDGEAIAQVTRIVQSFSDACVKIPKGLIGNFEDLTISDTHPVWTQSHQPNRIYAWNIPGAMSVLGLQALYTIQLDTEGSFYANGIKVDTLSPGHQHFPLQKEEFLDPSRYIEGYSITDEDDPRRNKPPMILLCHYGTEQPYKPDQPLGAGPITTFRVDRTSWRPVTA